MPMSDNKTSVLQHLQSCSGANKRTVVIIMLTIILFCAGCHNNIRHVSSIKDTSAYTFAHAEKYRQEGKWNQAILTYRQYITNHPDTEQAITALSLIADIYSQKGEFKKALALYETIDRDHPDYDAIPSIRYKIIRHMYLTGNYHDSLKMAQKWLIDHPSHPLTGQVMLVVMDDYSSLGMWKQAFDWWKKARETLQDTPSNRAELNNRIKKLIEDYEAYRSTKSYNEGPVDDWVLQARYLIDQANKPVKGNTGVIGCLLPLSGPFSIYGQSILNGIELGSGLITDFEENNSITEIDIKDTKGDPNRTVTGLEELVQADRVMALIGPLSIRTAISAAKKAQEAGVPIITLTQKDDVDKVGDMVFRNFISPVQEIRKLVFTAVSQLGIRRFAILYPKNKYGSFMMNCFWDTLNKEGGTVMAVESYDPDTTDFAEQIKKMTGMYYPRPNDVDNTTNTIQKKNSENKENEEEDNKIEPVVDFDAVFIPDNFETVAMIAPQLTYYDVKGVLLMGTSMWQSHKLIDFARDYVQGAIFTSGFYIDNNNPLVQDFVKKYRENFGKNPDIMAAYGYDTIRFLREVMSDKDIHTRTDLRDRLSQYCDFTGVTGQICLSPYRGNEGNVRLFTIKGNKIVPFESQ